MTAEQLQLVNLVLNALVLPGIYGIGRFLIRLDRRMLRVELRLNIEDKI